MRPMFACRCCRLMTASFILIGGFIKSRVRGSVFLGFVRILGRGVGVLFLRGRLMRGQGIRHGVLCRAVNVMGRVCFLDNWRLMDLPTSFCSIILPPVHAPPCG